MEFIFLKRFDSKAAAVDIRQSKIVNLKSKIR